MLVVSTGNLPKRLSDLPCRALKSIETQKEGTKFLLADYSGIALLSQESIIASLKSLPEGEHLRRT
jgi:hypothetical protein